jgi:putative salt-induced outer membrane protein YdiY
MDAPKLTRNDERKRRRRKNEGIARRKDTLIKKAYKLGELHDMALIICKHGRYTTYRSTDTYRGRKVISCMKYTSVLILSF